MHQRVALDIENIAYVHCETADISTQWTKKETCQTTVLNSSKQISLLAKFINIHRRISIDLALSALPWPNICYTRHRRRAGHIPDIMDYERHDVSVKCKNCSTCMHTLSDITMLSGIPSVYIVWSATHRFANANDAMHYSQAERIVSGRTVLRACDCQPSTRFNGREKHRQCPRHIRRTTSEYFSKCLRSLIGKLHFIGRVTRMPAISTPNLRGKCNIRFISTSTGRLKQNNGGRGEGIMSHCSTILYCIITGIRVC